MKSSSCGSASSLASCMIRFTAVDRRLTFGRVPEARDMVNEADGDSGKERRGEDR